MSWASKLPFGLGTEARRKRYKECAEDHSGAIVVHLFGTDKFRFVEGWTMAYIQIFNEKLNVWQNEACTDYYDICSVCGKLMHIYVVPGTSYIAACSKECTEQILKLIREEKPE